MVRTLGIFFILSIGVLLSSCDNYFGERTNLDFIEIPTYDVREISYVPIAPNIQDAVAPVDVYVGYESKAVTVLSGVTVGCNEEC